MPWRTAAEAVAGLGAVQAQEFAMACWALGLRTAGTREADILAALDRGEIVRTHVLRPTWHFVAATDLRWLIALSGPRVMAIHAGRYRELGLDAAKLKRCLAVVEKALTAETNRTREELQVVLARQRLRMDGATLAHVMAHAELTGLVCSGPRRGKKSTYALIEQRVPRGPRYSREEALAELARRYFQARGPATADDFASWSSFTLRDARAATEMLGEAFEREPIDGREMIFSRQTPKVRRDAAEALLLPDYDEFGLSYRHRQHFLDNAGAAAGFAFNRMIAVRGRFVGSWRRTFAGKRVEIELQLPKTLPKADREAVDRAVARYREFVR